MATVDKERVIVKCATCGMPGNVVFENGKIKDAFFVCKCPRPAVEEANSSEPYRGGRDG
jgi:hypothetical protein